MQSFFVERLPSIADQTIANVLAMIILAALVGVGQRFWISIARAKSDWIRNAVIVNASTLPILVLAGYAAYLGRPFLDFFISLEMAAVYSLMATTPSRSLRLFLFAAPNVLLIATAATLHWGGAPVGWIGAMYLYNLYFVVATLAALPFFLSIMLRLSRDVAKQDSQCDPSSPPPSPQRC